MSNHTAYDLVRLPREAGRPGEPMAGRVEVDEAAALAFPLIINPHRKPVAAEPLAEDISRVSRLTKFMEQPILRPLVLLPAFDQFRQIGVDGNPASCGIGLALLDKHLGADQLPRPPSRPPRMPPS